MRCANAGATKPSALAISRWCRLGYGHHLVADICLGNPELSGADWSSWVPPLSFGVRHLSWMLSQLGEQENVECDLGLGRENSPCATT